MNSGVIFAELIQRSKDGEWGKDAPFPGSVRMLVIRGTDFDAVRQGDWSGVPVRYIAERHAQAKELADRDILIETAGGSRDRPTGRTLYLRPGTVGRQPFPITCASFARFIRLDPSRIDPGYAFWWLQDLYVRGFLRAFQTQHTGVARFQWTTCSRSLRTPDIDMSRQRKVAAVLSPYDELLENNRRRIKLVEELAQRVYREWFVEFRYPGHEDDRLVSTNGQRIPEGWSWRRLGDLADDVRASVDPGSIPPSTPYFGLAHIPGHSLALDRWGLAGEVSSTKLRFQVGDVLLAKIRPYLHKVGPPPVPGVCSTDAIVIRPRDARDAALVLAVVSSDAFVAQAVQTSQGTKMPRANWSVLRDYPVPYPDRRTLRAFDDLVGGVITQIHRLVMTNRTLGEARDLLLPRLISGEIDVEHMNIPVEGVAA